MRKRGSSRIVVNELHYDDDDDDESETKGGAGERDAGGQGFFGYLTGNAGNAVQDNA